MSNPQVTPEQAKQRLDAGDADLVLLDVREVEELALARIEGATHIPMDEIPASLAQLDRDADYVVVCHHGHRSAMVCSFLLGRGFTRVANLRGGIDAWYHQADPSVGRY